jgi:hypothetical protein
MQTFSKMIAGASALLAATVAWMPAAHAFGDAPWCAVINVGTGEVYWDCQYRTVEECVPNVIAGNRGFCNVNPYGPGPSGPVMHPRYHSRHHKDAAQH